MLKHVERKEKQRGKITRNVVTPKKIKSKHKEADQS